MLVIGGLEGMFVIRQSGKLAELAQRDIDAAGVGEVEKLGPREYIAARGRADQINTLMAMLVVVDRLPDGCSVARGDEAVEHTSPGSPHRDARDRRLPRGGVHLGQLRTDAARRPQAGRLASADRPSRTWREPFIDQARMRLSQPVTAWTSRDTSTPHLIHRLLPGAWRL